MGTRVPKWGSMWEQCLRINLPKTLRFKGPWKINRDPKNQKGPYRYPVPKIGTLFGTVLGSPSRKKVTKPWTFSVAPHPLPTRWTQVVMAEAVGWVDFREEKKPMQNWSRGHFEATQKANFSILKPNFCPGDAAMGVAHWHNPKQSQLLEQNAVKSLFRSVNFLFWPALFWVAFFGNFSNYDFWCFYNGIVILHCLGRSQIYRRGYFPFQNSSTPKNDSTVSIFSQFTPKKSQFC